MRAKQLTESPSIQVEAMSSIVPEVAIPMAVCGKAIMAISNTTIGMKQGFALRVMAKVEYAMHFDGLLKEWKREGSQASKELIQYSERNSRSLRQGHGMNSLGREWRLDQFDENWEKFTLEDQKKARSQLANHLANGRLLAPIWRAWGRGAFALMHQPMITA
jgi:hypothetical protein